MSKVCSKCKEEFLATEEYFSKDRKTKDGLQTYCKNCNKEYQKKWRENKPEYHKKWAKKNKEKIKNNSLKFYQKNKEKIKNYQKKHYKENPEKAKNKQLKSKYGITLEQYNNMLENQNHYCAMCGRHESEFKRKLAVDEDHTTWKIRGLLCINCNRGIGFYDTYKKSIYKYLKIKKKIN